VAKLAEAHGSGPCGGKTPWRFDPSRRDLGDLLVLFWDVEVGF
jgi:hypothetical protein